MCERRAAAIDRRPANLYENPRLSALSTRPLSQHLQTSKYRVIYLPH